MPALAFFVGLLLASCLEAQSFLVHLYDEGDGLPSARIYDVTQGADGRIWLATRAGVVVYDGLEWAVHTRRDGLPATGHAALAFDGEGALWAASISGRVSRRVGGSWQSLPDAPLPSGAQALTLAITSEGRLGLLLKGGTFLVWDGAAWSRPFDRAVHSVTTDGEHFVLATEEGLAVDGVRVPVELPGPPRGLAVREDGTWLTGDGWLGILDRDGFHLLSTTLPVLAPFDAQRLEVEPDGYGGAYVGTQGGLFYVDPAGRAQEIGPASGLAAVGATTLYRDREENLWIGSLRGLSKIVSRRFANWTEQHGLLENEVSAVLEQADGRFVLGHPRGLSVLRNGRVTAQISFPTHGPGIRVYNLAADGRGTVWAAAGRLGLYHLSEAAPPTLAATADPPFQEVHWVHADRSGRLWVLTERGLFLRQEEPAGQRFRALGPAPQSYQRRLFEDRDGRFHIASQDGLLSSPESGVEGPWQLRQAPNTDANGLYALVETAAGEIWVGTTVGLYRAHATGLERVAEPEVRRPVYLLARDARDRIWIGTDYGALLWDPARRELQRLTVREGLVGRETNRGTGLVDSRGRVWIGTDRGVSVYHEEYERRRTPPPLLALTALEAGTRSLDPGTEARLSPRENDLVFRFRAMSFIDERRLRLRSRMEGLEDDWVESHTWPLAELRYASLPAGRYRLHLQAENAAGVPSPVVSSAWIRVAAPFWHRPSFFVLAVVAAALAGLAGHRFVAQRRYSQRLETEVARRTAELAAEKERHAAARRLNEEESLKARKLEALATLAGGIAHDFNNVLTAVLGNLELAALLDLSEDHPVRSCLTAAQDATLRARDLTRQLTTFAKGGVPIRELASLADVIRRAADDTRAATAVEVDLDLADNLRLVEIDVGQVQETVASILQHLAQRCGEGGTISVRARNIDVDGETEGGRDLLDLAPGRYVSLDVGGPRISAYESATIFDPYAAGQRGDGLALATAYSVVKRHGGRLRLAFDSGGTALFRIELPASERRDLPRDDSLPEGSSVQGSGRVLVMDDEEALLLVAGKMLRQLGYDPVCVSEGDAAVTAYRAARTAGEPFDAVLLDLTIRDGKGGRETMEELQELDPEIVAVVCSGYSKDPILARYQDYGFRGVLPKPYRLADLGRVLRKVLGGKRSPEGTGASYEGEAAGLPSRA